jgi:hypothetical protein
MPGLNRSRASESRHDQAHGTEPAPARPRKQSLRLRREATGWDDGRYLVSLFVA